MDEAASSKSNIDLQRHGLSPTLLSHAETGQHFLGFISYRRRDALPLARWLRDRITEFAPPPELKAKIAGFDESVGGAQNRVFLDLSYQKPNVDFWDEHIAASLCRSRTLLLLQTPSIFEQLDDGEPNWCEREIETFLKFFGDPSRILVVMGPGAPIERFPASLERISARWDWIDLRFFSTSPITRFRYGGQYDPQVAKVLAKLFDIEDGELPILNREFERARARARRNLAVAAGATIVGLSGLTTWALIERGRAAAAEKVAVQQRDEAVRQRNAALVSQSRYLANVADGLVKVGTTRLAVAVLREALPDTAAGRDRPLVGEAIASAYKAIFANHERRRLDMPPGAVAVATGGQGGLIVIATADKLYVREGARTESQRIVGHDFGAPKSIALSPDGQMLAMVAGDGTIAVRDLRDNRLVLQNRGAGPGAHVSFVNGGRRLLITEAGQSDLRLVDAESGRVIATRQLANAGGRPIVSLVEPEAGVLAFIADDRLLRLSLDDLGDLASVNIDGASEYAIALSGDLATIYVAAAKQVMEGRLIAFDARTLAVQRTFGRLAWGAKALSVSKGGDTIAVHCESCIEFFNAKTGDQLFHVFVDFPMTGGQFVGEARAADYMAWGSDGSIRRWRPEIGAQIGAYRTIDGGAIQRVEPLKDGAGFLSLSDRPSVTEWSFEARGVSKDFAIKNAKLDMNEPSVAFDVAVDRDEATVAYANSSVLRWSLDTGVARTVRAARTGEKLDKVVGLPASVTVASRADGRIEVYTDAFGSEAPLATLASEPLSYLGSISPDQAFFVAKGGATGRLDVATPDHPVIEPMPALGACRGAAAIRNFAICITDQGGFRMVRNSDGKLVADWPAPPQGLNYVVTSVDGALAALADGGGHVVVRRVEDGATLRTLDLKTRLSGASLAIAAKRLKLPDAQLAAIRAGATEVETPLPAWIVSISRDKTRLAVVLPFGIVQLFDLRSGSIRELRSVADESNVTQIRFSPHGGLLAVVTRGKSQTLVVYNAETGGQVASIALGDQVDPALAALEGGGFATIGTGHVLVHPVFEKSEDFIAYLSRQFPDTLSHEQRRFYFIE